MSAKKRRGVPKEIRVHINNFLATEKEVENLRDIWYQIKGDIEYLNNKDSDSAWDEYVNTIIGEHLYEDLFLQGHYLVYTKLGILTKALTEPEGIDKTAPIVLFSEKTTMAVQNACNSLRCARFDSTGQIPSFEAVKVAEYFREIFNRDRGYDAYIIALTDYDPAGESIYNSLVTKVREILYRLEPLIDLHQINISYGENYEDIINSYDNFTLSTNPKNMLNQKWIKSGKTKGVELNVLSDKQKMFEDTIMSFVDADTVELVALSRAKNDALQDLLNNDEEFLTLQRRLIEIQEELESRVNDADYAFTGEWTNISRSGVSDMIKLDLK